MKSRGEKDFLFAQATANYFNYLVKIILSDVWHLFHKIFDINNFSIFVFLNVKIGVASAAS